MTLPTWLANAPESGLADLAAKALADDQNSYPELWTRSPGRASAESAFRRGFLAGSAEGVELALRLMRDDAITSLGGAS